MWAVLGWCLWLGVGTVGLAMALVSVAWAYGAGLLSQRGWFIFGAKLRKSLKMTKGSSSMGAWGWSGPRGAWMAGLMNAVMSVLGWYAHRRLIRGLRDASTTSAATLVSILRLNASTAFGTHHHFESILALHAQPPSASSPTDASSSTNRSSSSPATRMDGVVEEAFKKEVPLARYEDLAPWVARIARGEQHVLTHEPIIQLGVTSGTSYSRKQLPVTRRQKTNFFIQGIAPLFRVLYTHFPNARGLQKSLKVMFQPSYATSEGGIKVGANSSAPSDSPALLHMYPTPPVAYQITSEPDLLYVHILFALKDEYLGMLEANFIMLIHHLFVRMEKQWRDLVTDIERGQISENVHMDEHIRMQLNQFMGGPDMERAQQLRREFEVGFDGIARRIWPYMNLVLSVSTGSFKLYAERAKYYLGDVPIYSPLYAATEGLLGVNLDPSQHNYCLVPSNMYIEFIELEHSDQDQPPTLNMDEVIVGREYELAVTTAWGLYRYRLGDVVKIVGFYSDAESTKGQAKGAPLIEFGYRLGQLLNVRGEKTSEQAMFQALSNSLQRWQGELGVRSSLVDYCCIDPALSAQFFQQVDRPNKKHEDAPHYDLFIELNGSDGQSDVWSQCASVLDEELCKSNPIYRSFRVKNGIGRAVIHQVRAGAFEQLRRLIVSTGTSPNQIKVPRVLRDPAQLECLQNGLL